MRAKQLQSCLTLCSPMESLCTICGSINWSSHYGNLCGISSKKLKIATIWSAVSIKLKLKKKKSERERELLGQTTNSPFVWGDKRILIEDHRDRGGNLLGKEKEYLVKLEKIAWSPWQGKSLILKWLFIRGKGRKKKESKAVPKRELHWKLIKTAEPIM